MKRNRIINNSNGQTENPLSTVKVSTKQARTTIKIPKNSLIYHYLRVDTHKGTVTDKLNSLLRSANNNRNEYSQKYLDFFIEQLVILYPEKKEKIRNIRQLVIWHILSNDELTEEYLDKIGKEII